MTTKQDPQTGNTNEAVERAEEQRILDEMKAADGKSAEFSDSTKIAQKLENGELDLTRDERMELLETLKDKNKMKEDPYNHFMTALAGGKFPNHGRCAMRFLEAIEIPEKEGKILAEGKEKIFPGKKEREYATELLKTLATGSPLSERSEMASLAKLEEFRLEEQAEKMGLEKEGEAQKGEVHAKVETASEISEVNDKGLWKIDRPPEGLMENLEAIETKMYDLMAQSNENHAKGESTEKLDTEIDRLEFERLPYRKQYIDYLRKAGERHEAIERKLAGETGIDLENIRDLIIEGKTIETAEPNVDPKTGKANVVKGKLKVTRAYFTQEKDDKSSEFAGELNIEYIDERGNPEIVGLTQFCNLVNALAIHQDIKNLADLNKEIARNTRYSEVREGQVYRTKVVTAISEDGEKVYEDREFRIEKIDTSGQEPVIILDRNATNIPKEWLSDSVDPALYFDRIQKEFSLGEFARLVKKHGYNREISDGDVQTVVDKMAKARRESDLAMNESVAISLTGKPATEVSRKRAEQLFAAPLATSGSVKIPNLGKTEPIEFYDEAAGGRRVLDATLTVKPNPKNPGQHLFEISYAETAANAANLTGLSGIPVEMLRAAGPDLPLEKQRIIRREFSPSAFMELADKDAVLNGHHAEEHPDFEEEDPFGLEQESHIPTEKPHHPEEKGGEEADSHETKKQKFYTEAATYEEAYQTGLPLHGDSQSFVRTLWNNTRFLSLDDLWQMGKTGYQYYDRRFEQRQKNRYGIVGKDLPFFGSEMQQISQAANNEQTSHFKEALEKKGIITIKERLRITSNKEEFKACIIVLTEKGMMNWHDVALWKNTNKFVKHGKEIPLPKSPNENNPYTHVSVSDDRTGYDFMEGAINSIWGDGYFGEWYSGNKNHYDSCAKNFYAEGKELEGVDGGHARKLANLLHHHKEGHFVDPMEYEGLLLHAIEAGKADMEDKIYYLVEGVASKNGKGETILTLDRMAHVQGEMLTRFPLMEYMCAIVPRPPDGKESSRFTFEDYARWSRWFNEIDGKYDKHNCHPTNAVNDFMWEHAIPSDKTQDRINKVARAIENVDHDDLYAYIPPATEDVLKDICKTNVGGRKGATIEGYANAFPGFSQYMKSLSHHGYNDKLAEAIKSYVLFEGIMTNKFEKQADSSRDSYQRMGDKTLGSSTICSTEPPILFIGQMNKIVKQIVYAYGDSELISILSDIQDLQVGDMSDPEEKKKQDRKNYAYQKFGKVLSRVTESDGQAQMLNIVQHAELLGMGYTPAPEKARRRAERAGKAPASHGH
ncbi:hypothetical protein COY05_01080 [Candidatus Peregrinibacteria bacterium CG_4_10_14_0_2_um_filter_38_24]|nr:MAG: hypothetical protein COY05_01080 [Candidatus Peregrinibacteria bacterium CG_4_10_14_0_2_um_filter_38_24]PJC38722.1 MAG: hypothetical protein CO044_03485 [Candidatus Peregrinibacteria bacterium CG_4_9_14_0_2_um_filter_38_9]